MKKLLIIGAIIISSVYANAEMINPSRNVNWNCIYPISIGGQAHIGNSKNPVADVVDKQMSRSAGVVCYCPLYRYGVTYGMNNVGYLVESTIEPYNIPSFGTKLSGDGSAYRYGGSEAPQKEGSRLMFVHTHINKYKLFEIINIFSDAMCLNVSGGNSNYIDILYMSETDSLANNSNLSSMVFPESSLVSNPEVVMSCAVDAVAASAGAPIDAMYWCIGSHAAFPASNFTIESDSFESASAAAIAKSMMRYNRYEYGFAFQYKVGNAGVRSCGGMVPSLQLPKSGMRMQPAYPSKGMCARLGASSQLWNKPKRSMPNGDMVHVLWEREDCCAF